MSNANEKAVSTLRELAEFIEDGNRGYQKAASETENVAHKNFYLEIANQRANFLSEINRVIVDHDGKQEDSGTVKGALYRTYMDAKAALTGGDEDAVVNSSIYGEEWAQKAYRKALEDESLTGEARQVVENQFQKILPVMDRLQSMKSGVNA